MAHAYTSLQSALRIPKVSAGYAPNAETERSQNPNLAVYPRWNQQDSYGRPVHFNSSVTLTAGASNPLQRMVVENSLRPSYSTYLNAGGIVGDEYTNLPSFGGYDALGVRRDEAFDLYGEYNIKPIPSSAGALVREETEQYRYNKAMQRRNQFHRYSADRR